MSERSQALFLSDILESIDAIQSYVIGVDFENSDNIKVQYPEVLWQEIKSFRNKITHEYFGVDVRIVWDIVQNELELLKVQAQIILKSLK